MPFLTQLPLYVRSIADLHQLFALPPSIHPLVSVLDLATDSCQEHVCPQGLVLDFYSVRLKKNVRGQLHYWQQPVDFVTGKLITLAPGQVLTTHAYIHSDSWGVVFAPALLHGHTLVATIRQYT